MPRIKQYIKKQKKRLVKAIDKRYGLPGKKVNWMQIGKDVMFLKNAINSEKKQKQFSINSFDISDGIHNNLGGYYVMALESPVAGINAENRIGNQFKLTSIQVQLDITNKNTFTNYVDVYFFQTLGDTLEGTLNQGGTIAERLFDKNNDNKITRSSFRNQESYSQIRILKRIRVKFDSPTAYNADATDQFKKELKFWLNLKSGSKYQHFDRNNANDSVADKNNIYMLAMSSVGSRVDTDPGATVKGAYRVSWVDN